MQDTTNYGLKKYEATDTPDLQTGYNVSMDTLDTQLKTTNNRIDDIEIPAGFAAFAQAIGVTEENATRLGTALNHLLFKTKSTDFTTKNLADLDVTAEGLLFVPDAS